MNVLIACEESGIVRDAFRALGHNAWSCDLQPCSGDPEFHFQDDVRDVIREILWDFMIAHPPCTYLANSGVRWLWDENGEMITERWDDMEAGRSFFLDMLNAKIKKVCIENPISHYHARLPRWSQLVQPWQFGDNFSKATCLWTRGLSPLVPSVLTEPADVAHECHFMSPGPERQKLRSRTYPGIANAMALQWGTDWQPQLVLEG